MDYSASKAAVNSITESVALYCAEKHYSVRCNSIKPGIIRTPMLETALAVAPDPDALLSVFNDRHPVGHIGDVSDVANVALFLASEKATYITGTSVAVDGGFLAL
jgi:3(or 17)beta-hydroxysteroid dehydrogenase